MLANVLSVSVIFVSYEVYFRFRIVNDKSISEIVIEQSIFLSKFFLRNNSPKVAYLIKTARRVKSGML